MENYNTQSKTWKSKTTGEILRLESDSIEVYLVRQTNDRIDNGEQWERFSKTWLFWDTLNAKYILGNDSKYQHIPRDRWNDLVIQFHKGENWQLEGKI